MSEDFFEAFEDSTMAKIAIYKEYIKRYLKVLSKAYTQFNNTKDSVYIADLFAGAGKDSKGNPGSPLVLLDYLNNTYLDGLKVKVLFNEADEKNFEILNENLSLHPIKNKKWVEYKAVNYRYENLIPQIIKKHKSHSFFKRFFFIDPFGYKQIKFEDLLELLEDGSTEILLFIPVSFIYRFRNREEVGAIHRFVDDFLGGTKSPIDDNKAFIKNMISNLREKTNKFVDAFIIECKNRTGYNCLVHFSSNKKGHEKFVEAKWEIDNVHGQQFEYQQNQMDLFEAVNGNGLEFEIYQYLKSGKKSNIDLRDFCFNLGFMPKHGKAALNKLVTENKITISGNDVRKGAFYLGETKKTKVYFEINNELYQN